jgi:hypothetical protein
LELSDSDFVFNRTSFESLRDPGNATVWQWSAIDQRNMTGINQNYFISNLTNLAINRPFYKTSELLKEIIEQNGYYSNISEVESVLDNFILSSNAKDFLFTDCEYEFVNENLTANVLADYDNAIENHTPVNFYDKTYTSFVTLINNAIRNKFIDSKYAIKGSIDTTELTNMIVEWRKPFLGSLVLTSNTYQIVDGVIDVVTEAQEKDTLMSIKFDRDVELNLVVSGLMSEKNYYVCKESISKEISEVRSYVGGIEVDLENIQANGTTLFDTSDVVNIYGGVYDGQSGTVSLASPNTIRISGITFTTDDNVGYVWLQLPNGDKRVYGWTRENTVTNIPLLQDYLIKASYNLPDWNQFDFVQELSRFFFLDFSLQNETVKVTFKKDLLYTNALEINRLIDNARKFLGKTDLSDDIVFTYNDRMKRGYYQKSYNNPNLKQDISDVVVMLSDTSSENIVYYSAGSEYFKIGSMPIYSLSLQYNENEDDRAEINHRFYFVTNSELVSSSLIAEINAVGYFSNASKTNVIPENSMIMNELYDKYYSFLFDKIGEAYIIKYSVFLSYLDFIKIMKNKIIYDSKLNKYFLVLSISKFNPSQITELNCIGL